VPAARIGRCAIHDALVFSMMVRIEGDLLPIRPSRARVIGFVYRARATLSLMQPHHGDTSFHRSSSSGHVDANKSSTELSHSII